MLIDEKASGFVPLESSSTNMILAVDVFYQNSKGSVAGLLFENWVDEQEKAAFTSACYYVQEYVSGQFYRRELPCILKLIEEHCLKPDCIIIDGFVYLDGIGRPGLGKYLYEALQGKVAVIGVAKNMLKGLPAGCEVYRGKSLRPLYVTSVGVEPEKARRFIRMMHGVHRIPTLLKKVDQLCRQNTSGPSSRPGPDRA